MKAIRICAAIDCDRAARSRGYCKTHYSRLLRTGTVGDDPIHRDVKCSVDGCESKHAGRGYCAKHYKRLIRRGDVTHERPSRPAACSVDGCERTVEARGLCKMHYTRWWEGREIGGAAPLTERGRVCGMPDCGKPHVARSYCSMHLARWLTHGDPNVRLFVPGGDDIGYGSAHQRVRRRRGSASQYPCAHCGSNAKDWAYDHADPNERIVENRGKRLPISLSIDHYMPLCRNCHRNFDLSQ